MQSYDGSTHFESTVTDVLAMYSKITGKVTKISNYHTDHFEIVPKSFFFCKILLDLIIGHENRQLRANSFEN